MASDSTDQEIDTLIHEPARLRVLVLLAMIDQADFMYILRQTGLTRGNLSVQMTRLEAGGMVGLERHLDGNRPRTVYSLTPAGRTAVLAYKRTLTELLAAIPEPR